MSTLSCITEANWSQRGLFSSACFLCRGRWQETCLSLLRRSFPPRSSRSGVFNPCTPTLTHSCFHVHPLLICVLGSCMRGITTSSKPLSCDWFALHLTFDPICDTPALTRRPPKMEKSYSISACWSTWMQLWCWIMMWSTILPQLQSDPWWKVCVEHGVEFFYSV